MTEYLHERVQFKGKVSTLEILKFLQKNVKNDFKLPSNLKEMINSPGTRPAKGKYVEDL